MRKFKKDDTLQVKQKGLADVPDKVSRGRIYLAGGAIMLALLLLDQFTKHLAVLHLKGNPPMVLINGILELQYLENTGSAFSLFQGQKVFILGMGFVFLGAVLYFVRKIPARKKFLAAHILIAVLIAGALGNIIDRIRYDFVVDFISFVLIHFPVFNVADCYIVVSAICLFLLFMFVYKEEDLEWIGSASK